MSAQEDIETAAVAVVAAAVPTFQTRTGPRTLAQVEGFGRAAVVWFAESSTSRLEYGQNDLSESYVLLLVWPASVARDVRFEEWATISAAFLADQYLGGAISGLTDSWLGAADWGEPVDAGKHIMVASVEVARVE